MKRPLLYLPIETKVRELYGKTFLAARAAARGWQVLMGEEREIRVAAGSGPPGVVVELSPSPVKAERIAGLRSRGHRVAALCEEAIVYVSGLDYCESKAAAATLDNVDAILVTGPRNEAHLREHRPAHADRIRLTGNPRFDVLQPRRREVFRPDADAIAARHGRFLLVNTNFSIVNHLQRDPEQRVGDLTNRHGTRADELEALIRRRLAYQRMQLDHLRPLLADIAARRQFDTVVVRPHPSEDRGNWRTWTASLEGVEVIAEGSANTWLLAAAAILHTGCTTGIEATLLDRPVASLVPESGHEMLNQADEVSEPVATPDDFAGFAARWAAIGEGGAREALAPRRATLRRFVRNVDPPAAVDAVLDVFGDFDVEPVDPARPRPSGALGLRRALGSLLGLRSERHHRQKFAGLETREIEALLGVWAGDGSLEARPSVERIGPASFRLAPDDA